jgi:hypothetical protein
MFSAHANFADCKCKQSVWHTWKVELNLLDWICEVETDGCPISVAVGVQFADGDRC